MIVYADRDTTISERPCPNCQTTLQYEVTYPPIPLVVRRWWASDDVEQGPIEICPNCQTELPA